MDLTVLVSCDADECVDSVATHASIHCAYIGWSHILYLRTCMQLSVCVTLVLQTVIRMPPVLTEMEVLTVCVTMATLAMEHTVMVRYICTHTIV